MIISKLGIMRPKGKIVWIFSRSALIRQGNSLICLIILMPGKMNITKLFQAVLLNLPYMMIGWQRDLIVIISSLNNIDGAESKTRGGLRTLLRNLLKKSKKQLESPRVRLRKTSLLLLPEFMPIGI
jgi:hypothetical protein